LSTPIHAPSASTISASSRPSSANNGGFLQQFSSVRPAALDLGRLRIPPTNLKALRSRVNSLPLNNDRSEKSRSTALARELRRLHLHAGLAQQHATTVAIPHGLLALDEQQATAFALGGQPHLIARRVDRQPSNNALKCSSMPLARASRTIIGEIFSQ
jgi:hypothetical protein